MLDDRIAQHRIGKHHPERLEDAGAVLHILARHRLDLRKRPVGPAHRLAQPLHLHLHILPGKLPVVHIPLVSRRNDPHSRNRDPRR